MTAAVAPAAPALPPGDLPVPALAIPAQPGPAIAPGVSIGSFTGPGRRAIRRPRLVPVPICEPPFDDELFPARGAITEFPSSRRSEDELAPSSIAGATVAARNSPAGPNRAPRQDRPVTPGRMAAGNGSLLAPPRSNRPTTIAAKGVPSWSSEADIGVRMTASEHLPAAEPVARMLARAAVEVLSGQRSLAQLRVHCAPEIFAGLVARPILGQLGLPHVLTVRVCEPADGVAEVSAAFRRSERVRALAFRMEGVDGRWRITALQLG